MTNTNALTNLLLAVNPLTDGTHRAIWSGSSVWVERSGTVVAERETTMGVRGRCDIFVKVEAGRIVFAWDGQGQIDLV